MEVLEKEIMDFIHLRLKESLPGILSDILSPPDKSE